MAEPFGSLAPYVDPMTAASEALLARPGVAQIGEKLGRIGNAVWGGLQDFIETPGRAYRDGMTTEQMSDWAAPMALSMVAGGRIPGGAPAGAAGSSGGKLVQPERAALPMDEASRMARAEQLGYTLDAYHGTRVPEFDAFKRRQNDLGVHFGTAEQAGDRLSYLGEAQGVSGGERVLPVKLNLENPLRMDDLGGWGSDSLSSALRTAGFDQNAIRLALQKGNESGRVAALRDLIERRGHDGVVYRNTGETGGSEPFRAAERQARAEMHTALEKNNGFTREDQAHPAYQKWKVAEEAYTKHRNENAQDSYIAFRPNQIRSRFATFDPSKAKLSDILAGALGIPAAGAVGAAGDQAFGSLAP